MTDLQRHTAAVITSWVIEEKWSQEQLNAFLRYLNGWQWSKETEKVVRAADGLLKEIIHRDSSNFNDGARPWENLLGHADMRLVERAIQDHNDGRVF